MNWSPPSPQFLIDKWIIMEMMGMQVLRTVNITLTANMPQESLTKYVSDSSSHQMCVFFLVLPVFLMQQGHFLGCFFQHFFIL